MRHGFYTIIIRYFLAMAIALFGSIALAQEPNLAASALSQTWVYCATEGGFCNAPLGAIIHFGLNSTFYNRSNASRGLPCNSQTFGDPLPGLHDKVCLFSSDIEGPPIPTGWVHCATEGGYCRAPSGMQIHYGLKGNFFDRKSPPGGLACNNSVFTDPLIGVHKECFASAEFAPSKQMSHIPSAADPEANAITSQQEFGRTLDDLVASIKRGDRREISTFADKAVHWAQSHGVEVVAGRTENANLLQLNALFMSASDFALQSNQIDLGRWLAEKSADILRGDENKSSKLMLYISLVHLMKFQWETDAPLAAKKTAEEILKFGFEWVVESSIWVYEQSNPSEFKAVPGEESRYGATSYWMDTMNGMIAALLASQVPQDDLAEVVFFRKGIISDILRDTFVGSQARDDEIGDVFKNKKIKYSALFDALRENVSVTAQLAYSSTYKFIDGTSTPKNLSVQRTEIQKEILRFGEFKRYDLKLDDIIAAVPPGYLVIQYVRYLRPNVTVNNQAWPAKYLAFALTSEGVVGLVDIGTVQYIESYVYEACRSIIDQVDPAVECQKANYVIEPKANIKINEMGRDLYHIFLEPFDQYVKAASHIVIAPEGAINFLPFEVLIGANNRFLVMDHVISYIDNVRDLLRWNDHTPSAGPPVAIGSPEFSGHKDETREACAALLAKADRPVRPPTLRTATDSLQFAPLCHSAAEVDGVHNAFPDTIELTGTRATVDAVKHLRAPRILHFATHGFAVPDLTWSQSWRNSVSEWTNTDYNILRNDPMVRGGLALTGANVRAGPEGRDDGILSAGEVRFLRLSGTQLVVLSACDTGLGPVFGSESVLGLRSAFREAGARAETFALWPTDDDNDGVAFMTQYYHALAGGVGNAEALALVKRAFIDRGGGLAKPWVWANLVAYGYPGPLDQ